MYDHYSVMSVKRFGRKVPWKRMLYHLKLSSDLQTLVKIWAKSHNSSTSVFGTRYLSAISSQSSQLCFSWPTWCKGKAAAQLELPPPDVGNPTKTLNASYVAHCAPVRAPTIIIRRGRPRVKRPHIPRVLTAWKYGSLRNNLVNY